MNIFFQSMMGQLKEKKDIEDLFKKAQKPWAKVFEKVNKCRADYHSACKNERSAQNQERNAGGDSSLSPDQVRCDLLSTTELLVSINIRTQSMSLYNV